MSKIQWHILGWVFMFFGLFVDKDHQGRVESACAGLFSFGVASIIGAIERKKA